MVRFQNYKRILRPDTALKIGKWSSPHLPQQSQLLWRSHNSRTLTPKMAPNYFQPHRWQLQGWMRQKIPRPPSAPNPSLILHHHHRLLGKLICGGWRWPNICYHTLPAWVIPFHRSVHWQSFVKYRYTQPKHYQLTPNKHIEIKYKSKQQLRPEYDTSPGIDAAGVKKIQDIIGALLYYAHTVNNKLLVRLRTIGVQQAAATEYTANVIKQLLDYVDTYLNDGIVYCTNNMVPVAQFDAGFNK